MFHPIWYKSNDVMMMYAVFTQHLMQLEREQSRTHLVGGWSWSAGDGGGLYFVVAFRSVSEVGHRFFCHVFGNFKSAEQR